MKKENNTIIKSISALVLIILMIGTYGCHTKNNPGPTTKTDFTDLKIDPNFKFSTTKEIPVHLELITTNPEETTRKFAIYNGNPESNGKLIISGITNPYHTFDTEIKIPTYVEKLYITCQDVNNEIETAVVDATGSEIFYSFETVPLMKSTFKSVSSTYTDPGCGTCDEYITGGPYNKYDIKDDKVYCIAAGQTIIITNELKFDDESDLIVCGTLDVKKIKAQNNSSCDLVISAGGSMLLDDGNIDKDLDNVINFGTVTVDGTAIIKDFNFENHGVFTVLSNGIDVYTNDFYNHGTMTIGGHFNNNNKGYNYGTLTVNGHYNSNGSTREFTNECNMAVNGNFNNNGTFTNEDNSYLFVLQNLRLNGQSTTILGAQSLMETTDIQINSTLIGPSSSCARINVSDVTNINGSGNVSGYLDICDADGIENNNGTVANEVSFDCSCYIPTNNCNPGSGTPQNPDSDGDGCPDDQDDYPNDPARCSNDYYPNATDYTSLAFEDLWTSYGDYDFNDLVVMTNYQIVKNAQNDIVELFGKFHIAAVGAHMNNGFGVEFDIPTSSIQSVTGTEIDGTAVTINANGAEDGPLNKAVVIVYDAVNDYLGSAMVNTIPGGNSQEIDTITVHILFSQPQTTIGTPPYNPFMFISQTRGKEIHLIDHAPTELVDASYFGVKDDDSDPTIDRYYVSPTNLPWVIEIPDSFEWPKENADILLAYLKFQQWAESSGQLFPDWYENQAGYRDDNNIY